MICNNCAKFKVFKQDCHFFFENKKECSQYQADNFEEDELFDLVHKELQANKNNPADQANGRSEE